MKYIVLMALLTFSFNVFSAKDSTCEVNEDCSALSVKTSEFNNPEVTSAQADKAFVMADEILNDIGRSIAGDFEDAQ